MAVVLRLQRFGKRTQPHYRVVAIEKSRGPKGAPLEIVGHYNPKAEKEKEKITIDLAKLDRWVKSGAKASGTLETLITKVRKAETAPQTKAA